MLLISAGNEITGGATVSNEFVVANDDFRCVAMGEIAHPDNVIGSYGYFLSRFLKLGFKCLISKTNNNQDVYRNIVNLIENSPAVKNSKYTVLIVGLFPDNRKNYDHKISELCYQYSIEYYSFDLILDFMTWCRNNKYLNQFGYPNKS